MLEMFLGFLSYFTVATGMSSVFLLALVSSIFGALYTVYATRQANEMNIPVLQNMTNARALNMKGLIFSHFYAIFYGAKNIMNTSNISRTPVKISLVYW